jgi:hypothetical protein
MRRVGRQTLHAQIQGEKMKLLFKKAPFLSVLLCSQMALAQSSDLWSD